jgi:hypothetical protein
MKRSMCLFVAFSLFIVTDAFGGSFGINFGMSLEQVRQISRTTPTNIEDDLYIITPPNTHETFGMYVIQIHPTYGVYFIKAISRNIYTNRHGTELIARFNNLVTNIERTYGKYSKIDTLNPESVFTESQYFMYTLSRGDRELLVFWNRDEGSRMPDDLLEIDIYVEARNSSIGIIIVEYHSTDYDKIEEERSSVF